MFTIYAAILGQDVDMQIGKTFFRAKTASAAANSGKLRNGTPQSPALKKVPSPVVMVPAQNKMGSGPNSY